MAEYMYSGCAAMHACVTTCLHAGEGWCAVVTVYCMLNQSHVFLARGHTCMLVPISFYIVVTGLYGPILALLVLHTPRLCMLCTCNA
jgi:hypothetical protein